MKKLILTMAIALIAGFNAMSQNGMRLVTDVEEGVTYLTPITELPGGGVKIDVVPWRIVNANTAVAQKSEARLIVVSGPKEIIIVGNAAAKVCNNTNIWPCMIIRGASPE